jgi:hypothetical protein
MVFLIAAPMDGVSHKHWVYFSPDYSWMAEVDTYNDSESLVTLRNESRKVVSTYDFGSEDKSHGYAVERSRWTPDSQFFVFSLVSSGGHSPTHSPVVYFSRQDKNFHSLDAELERSIASDTPFKLLPPDKVTVRLLDRNEDVTVSLSSIKKHQLMEQSKTNAEKK